MLRHAKVAMLIVASGLVLAVPNAQAQSATRIAQTDPRWYPWLGCWAADASETGEQSTSSSTTCIVPISGSAAVEALTIARHKVIARDRLDSSRPHSLDGQGCEGMEAVNWSTTGRRVFVRADYTCASGVKGTSTTLFSFSPSGEWLRVEEVRSGAGATVSVSRLRDIGLLDAVAPDAARAIENNRRAIVAARAAAAAAITAQEITDATYALNAGVVSAWLFASDQRYNVDTRDLAALTRSDLPFSVLQTLAVIAGYQPPSLYSPNGNGDVYMNSSSVYVAPQQVDQNPYDGYPCSPLNCPYTPYSAFNGFGFPFGGFPVTFVTQRGINKQPFVRFQSHGKDGKPSHGGKWQPGTQGRPGSWGGGRSGGGGGGGRR
jgi:uncharacterized membrane protein YgcG